MFKYLSIVLMLPAFLAADEPKEDGAKAELKKFSGNWKVVLAERDGEKLTANKVKAIKVSIVGDKITIKDNQNDDVATIKVDPTQKPATIDFQPADEEKPVLGIYEWSADRLKLCWAKAGGARPKEFATRVDVETALFELEREK